MYATLTNWRLKESVLDVAAYDLFAREMVQRNINSARDAGMVDSLLIRVEPDTLLGVSVYETEEDAAAAGPVARQAVGNVFADKLEFRSRISGRMDDMPALPGRNLSTTDLTPPSMYASVTSWRLHESLWSEQAYTAFLKQVMEQQLALALEIGLLDAIIIRSSEDQITSVGLYESEAAATAAMERSTTVYNEQYTAVLELLDRQSGRADDIPRLLGRWE